MSSMTYPCYQQRKNSQGQWYWVFYAANREEIAKSSESYFNRKDCTNGIVLIRDKNEHHPIYYFE